MVSTNIGNDKSNLIQTTLEWIADAGINGLGILPSAKQVAEDHLSKSASVKEAINSVIAWRTTYAAGTGFIAGLGGIAAMPITIPAGVATSYALAANTVATIAYLRGYDIHSEQVKTMILLCLIGEAGEKGAVNLMKMVPLVGGVVGGTFDGIFVNSCGKTAKKLFKAS